MGFTTRMRDYLTLIGLKLYLYYFNSREFLHTLFHYYHNSSFRKIDLYLTYSYLFRSPFTISKEFLQRQGAANLYAYGETPLSALKVIARECDITAKETLYELGCGTGRGCFWLNCFTGCKVVGIDFIPEFIEKADATAKKYSCDVHFRCEEMLQTPLEGATVIYLYGTSLEDEFIEKLIARFKSLPAGTKIITVSYPLSDYCKAPLFDIAKQFEVTFPWGKTDLYLNVKT